MDFSGPIPKEIAHFAEVKEFWINSNQPLSGIFPPEICRMKKLEVIQM
jgi:hypothetical protein